MGARQPPEGDGSRWRNVLVGEVAGWIDASTVRPVSHAPSGAPRDSQDSSLENSGPLLAPMTVSMPAPATPGGTATVRRMRVTADRLALRVTPDINAPVLRQLRSGAVVHALPQPQRSYWTAIQAGDQRGWVASQWLAPDDRP
jgi:pilus assembly protein CpaC